MLNHCHTLLVRSGLLAALLGAASLAAQPATPSGPPLAPVTVDLAAFETGGGAKVAVDGTALMLTWPAAPAEIGAITFNLDPAPGRPLFESIALGALVLARRVDPACWLTIGQRDLGAPAGWVAFFDNPPHRSYQRVPAVLKKTSVRVTSAGSRTVVRIGDVTAGSFRGVIELTVTRNSPAIFIETVVSTADEGRAILYDAGLVSAGSSNTSTPWADPAATTSSPLVPGPVWKSFAWLDPEGSFQRAPADLNRVAAPLTVSRRVLVAEGEAGAIAAFPPPHQYFYPLDFANNLGFVWYGSGRSAHLHGYGFGIRQPPEGDRVWVPWVNAPPRTEQRLGIFYLLAADAKQALAGVGRYTRDDRYAVLPGYRTFTSHYHVEHTLEFAKAQLDKGTAGVPRGLEEPGFVKTFQARGVDIVHLGELHVGSMPRLAAKDRLALLKTKFAECERLSECGLLVLPGEEPNVHLGGHWMSFFPKPVYWVLHRGKEQPLVEEVPGYGKVYHVGSPDDVLELMQRERGLMWTAHARIKGSRLAPELYWDAPFFRSDRFLGAAWKAMPADLSQPRLGKRVLDVLDDMANAGLRKYVIGEADLFRMEPDAESYAHMNINYVKLDAVPRFRDGWQPVLDALSGGKFFVTTGEVLIPRFTVGGRESGETLARPSDGTMPVEVEVEADLQWTFPLTFAELVSGDGATVHRQRIDLLDTETFGQRTLRVKANLAGRTWVRLEVWDQARNGAFTQPVWLGR